MKDEFVKPRPSVAVSPIIALVLALALSILLLVLPAVWTAPLKGAAAAALGPGQRAALALRNQADRATGWARRQFHTAAQLAEAQQRIDQLEAENRRLAARAAAAPSDSDANQSPGKSEGLLLARAIEARVLGRQARAYLARQEMLDAGTQQGVQLDALVLDAPPLVDRGRDADLRPGRLVLAGRSVWGKVVEVGPYTSVVRRVTESGYRDVVRLAGAQGIVEGNGQPLARVRLIGIEEPVEVGDPVYAAATDGVLDEPLLYGRVARLERPIGAAHWEIWMEPAAPSADPRQVSILRIELNPRRVGEKPAGVRR